MGFGRSMVGQVGGFGGCWDSVCGEWGAVGVTRACATRQVGGRDHMKFLGSLIILTKQIFEKKLVLVLVE